MGRIMAIDYGQKRVGIAVTDPAGIIASALTTVHVQDIFPFLKQYFSSENVERVIVGEPLQMNNTPSASARFIEPFVRKFSSVFPEMALERADERYTSKMAHQTMIMSGMRKKARQNKEKIDAISATIILQSYLEKQAAK
ncbi:MAG: Holliday junction resolvase RuvX [Flavobacteriales bacterium]|nr:Holliday junction resolvase RuvX [Flavobacteriales bacterium]MBL4734678.1 Holliday junction resolvase RuvX [Flavobacteriales bacterium]PCH89122.1 MAG: Holliday junction resolvase RuvX [Flavobacteriales bacterium]